MIKKEDDAIAMRKMDLEMERLDEAAMAKDPEIIACEGVRSRRPLSCNVWVVDDEGHRSAKRRCRGEPCGWPKPFRGE